MLKKTIQYNDFNGVSHTEDFYFNLSESELIDMEMNDASGSYKDRIEKIVQAKEPREIIGLFRELIEKSYGQKSLDGKRFVKNPEVLADFMQSEAYNAFFMDILSDIESAAAFINGLMPAGLMEKATLAQAEGRELTSEEIRARSEASLQGHNPKVASKEGAFVTEPTPEVAPAAPNNYKIDVDSMTPEAKAELLKKLGY